MTDGLPHCLAYAQHPYHGRLALPVLQRDLLPDDLLQLKVVGIHHRAQDVLLSLCLDLLCRGACEEPPPQILQLSLLGIVVALQLPDGRGLTLDEFVFEGIRPRVTVSAKAWEETRDQYATRLKTACEDVNATCNVEGLCRGFMNRINQLVECQGGRLAR